MSVERASPADVMELAADVGPVPMQVGGILVFDADAGLSAANVRDALGSRIRGIPRLRQRLVRAPFGCGRPVWVDDPDFEIARHVTDQSCPEPGDEAAMLRAAAAIVTRPLAAGRPLWSATLVTDCSAGTCALIFVMHHVLADGMGGLAVLASLVDCMPQASARAFPQPPPSPRELAQDAATARLRAMTRLHHLPARLFAAMAELRPGSTPAASRCSLIRATGPGRGYAVARADLAGVRRVAHAHGGTVNDVALAAVSAALTTLLAARGERAEHLVASVLASGRSQAAAADLGNEVGVIPVPLPTSGTAADRLSVIARTTRQRKTQVRGASAGVLAAGFRMLASAGLIRLLIEHQHLITTFVTNLRGPDRPVCFLGATVRDIVPLNALAGNVTVGFAVLSYAGRLNVAVVADTTSVPDVGFLADELQRVLDDLTVDGRDHRAMADCRFARGRFQ